LHWHCASCWWALCWLATPGLVTVVLDTFPVLFALKYEIGPDPSPETICCKDLRVRSRPPLCQSLGWF
jgi:hypothetical protein